MLDLDSENIVYNPSSEKIVSPSCVLPDGTSIEGKDLIEFAEDFIRNEDNKETVQTKLLSLALLSPDPYSFMIGYMVSWRAAILSKDQDGTPKISIVEESVSGDAVVKILARKMDKRIDQMKESRKEIETLLGKFNE